MGVAKLQLPVAKASTLPAGKDFYSTGEVAKLFGVTPQTVVNWCNNNHLACITTPSGHRRIPVSAFVGGREYDARLADYQAMMANLLEGAPAPAGDEIAAQIRARR